MIKRQKATSLASDCSGSCKWQTTLSSHLHSWSAYHVPYTVSSTLGETGKEDKFPEVKAMITHERHYFSHKCLAQDLAHN